MSICTQCGIICNDEDEHNCDPSDIPAVGEYVKAGKKYDLKTKELIK